MTTLALSTPSPEKERWHGWCSSTNFAKCFFRLPEEVHHRSLSFRTRRPSPKSSNVSSWMKTFASQQRFHAVCKEHKQAFSTKLVHLILHPLHYYRSDHRIESRSSLIFFRITLMVFQYVLKCFELSNILSSLHGVSFLYVGIQYIASIMSRNGVDSTRDKTSTDRMLTKTSKGVLTQSKKEVS